MNAPDDPEASSLLMLNVLSVLAALVVGAFLPLLLCAEGIVQVRCLDSDWHAYVLRFASEMSWGSSQWCAVFDWLGVFRCSAPFTRRTIAGFRLGALLLPGVRSLVV